MKDRLNKIDDIIKIIDKYFSRFLFNFFRIMANGFLIGQEGIRQYMIDSGYDSKGQFEQRYSNNEIYNFACMINDTIKTYPQVRQFILDKEKVELSKNMCYKVLEKRESICRKSK